MFNGGFAEAETGCALLPEDCPRAFKVFVEWLHLSRMSEVESYVSRKQNTLLELGIFASKYDIPELQDRAMDHPSSGTLALASILSI
jgi:hypothetical protein